MPVFIHCADLHLSAANTPGRIYGLAVLDEVMSLARDENASAVLFCGDLFDSFGDIENAGLRKEFRDRIATLPENCNVIFIAGNHEAHGGNGRSIKDYDLGRDVRVVEQSREHPFQLVVIEGVEVLCIPHQVSCDGYGDWAVPSRQTPVRIALAHGLVAGMDIYTGPAEDEGEKAGVLDPDLFNRFEIAYAALGHIHGRKEQKTGGTCLCYPGSARVFRKGETGQHGVCVLRIDNGVKHEFRPLKSAGEFRIHDLALQLDGGCDDLEGISGKWRPEDWICLRLSGVVDDENRVGELERRIREKYECGSLVRRLDVDRSEVQPLAGISSHPLAKEFLAEWKRRHDMEHGADEELWMRARQIGLKELVGLIQQSGGCG
ncbi:MAG: metallophosphoesterase [Verrucomicrobiae bacterium]|nr:metallophosphoesterase [Verrucomicrobiae bacterium]